MKRAAALVLVAALQLGSAGCAYLRDLGLPLPADEESKPGKLLVEVEGDAVPGFGDDSDADTLLACLHQSLDELARLPPERSYVTAIGPVTVADLQRTIELFLQTIAAGPRHIDWRAILAGRFRVYRAEPRAGLLFTGYYQPELAASRQRTERFAYPLYRVPDDLVRAERREQCPSCEEMIGRNDNGSIVPYYSRAEIDGYGELDDRDLELAWVEDPIDLFFLHVQGSGLLRFEDGTAMQVGFAASNGRKYKSIGKMLVESGKVPLQTASLESLRQYLRDHPGERDAILYSNERYIFFRPVPVGPIGSFGVPLTPGRSIAVDPAAYPLGSLAWIRSQRPGEDGGEVPLARFVCAQDAGAAIAGPGRVDVFWGNGPEAERIAGPMRAPGEMFLLLAK